MSEQQIPENDKPTPYDLWPDEPVPDEPAAIYPPAEHLPDSPFADFQDTPFNPPEEEAFHAPFIPVAYTPETTEENVRQSGLAWSAGVVFFGAVAFMLFLGWLVDLLLGSSPWGIVGGIVLGSIIGFIQFFRISSHIFAPKNSDHRPFLSRDDDEK